MSDICKSESFDIADLIIRQKDRCSRCGDTLTEHFDSLEAIYTTPINEGGSPTFDNIEAVHRWCQMLAHQSEQSE